MPRPKKNGRKNNKNRNFRPKPKKEIKKREQELISIRNSNDGAGVTFSAFYPSMIKANAVTATLSMLPVRSFYRMSRGQRVDQMIGTEISSKSLYLKGKILGLPPNNSVEAFIVHGWVKDRLGFTDFTTPTKANATREDVETFVYNQCRQHFDEKSDEMRYRTAKKDNILIKGYRKLQHPKEASYQDDVDFKCTWKTGRKVVYTECYKLDSDSDPQNTAGNNSLTTGVGGGPVINLTDTAEEQGDALGGDIGQFLPLNSWLPFALVYIPKISDISPGSIQLQYNSVHYFSG